MALAPAAAAESAVGEAVASSFQFSQDAPTEADAYLLGFRQNATNSSPYQWSFQADQVSVSVTTRHYTGYQETSNRTEETRHVDASGVLLERHPLAYLMATSANPDDPDATFQLDLDLPPDSLEPRNSIDYDTITEGGAPSPVFGSAFDGEDPGSTQPVASIEQPWPNLERRLTEYHDAIRLSGNFAVHVYDVVFQVQDGAGNSATYNVSYGGWRGLEPERVEPPPAEWDVQYAELVFTNATFSFFPEGRPLDLHLQTADLHIAGQLILHDVRGELEDAAGIQRSIGGTLVEIDAKDLRLNAQVPGGQQATPKMQLGFNGSINSATVDGRNLHVEASDDEPAALPVGIVPAFASPDVGTKMLSPWWILAVAGAVVGVAIWYGRRQYHARMNPEFLVKRGQFAMEEGLFTRALSLAKRVLRHHPEETEAVALRAMLHFKRKQYWQIILFLKPYLYGPADVEGTLSVLYLVALRREKGVEEAREFYDEAVKRYPTMKNVAEEYQDLDLETLLPQNPRAESSSYI